jgi:hypothetical protein
MVDSTVSSDGIDPPMMATSIAEGAYALENVPSGSKVFFSVSHTGYRPTRNVAVGIADAAVIQDLYVMSVADVNRQYTTDGKIPTPGKAFVIAELQRINGMPADAVPLADIKLLDNLDAPVPGVIGPYVIGAAGDITPGVAITVTEAHNNKVRVAFLDVPPGTFKVNMTVPGQTQLVTSSMTTVADGATLHKVGGMGGGGGGGGNLNPKFATDVFPRLQTAAKGGLGCGNCHTLGGLGGVLVFDGTATTVLEAMKAIPGVIDLVAPGSSLLLTKPLYEPTPPQNHPNATFIDLNDLDYKLINLWITQGALP